MVVPIWNMYNSNNAQLATQKHWHVWYVRKELWLIHIHWGQFEQFRALLIIRPPPSLSLSRSDHVMISAPTFCCPPYTVGQNLGQARASHVTGAPST